MMTRCSSVLTLKSGFIATSCCEFASSSIWCRMDDLSVQLRGCPSLKNSAFGNTKNSEFPRASSNLSSDRFRAVVKNFISRFFSSRNCTTLLPTFFNRLVVCYKRFEVGDQTYISVESFRNKILISGMSSAGMINNFSCKQSWSNCLQNNVKNNKPNSSNKQTPQQTQSQTGPSI